MAEIFDIRNTLDEQEYRILSQLLNRIPYSQSSKENLEFNILEERLEEPLSLVFIRCGVAEDLAVGGRKRPRLANLTGRLAVAERISSFDEKGNKGKHYLTEDQIAKGVGVALEQLGEEFDIHPVYKRQRLTHKNSGYVYVVDRSEGFHRNLTDVLTLPAYRKIEPAMLQADTENVIRILESLANGMLGALGERTKKVISYHLETNRPSNLYPISRNGS